MQITLPDHAIIGSPDPVSASPEALEAMDLVTDGYLLLDSGLRFIHLNRAAESLAGVDRDSLVGHSVFDAFPVLVGSHLEAAYRRATTDREPMDFHADSPTGRTYDVHVRPSAPGIYVVFRDVTEQRAREEALQSALASEHVARLSAEAAEQDNRRRRQAETFVAEAGRVLASSLDFETTLKSVAKLAVPRLADWCVIHMTDENGGLRQLAVAHQDPNLSRWARKLGQRYPPNLDAPRGLGRVLRSGKPEVFPEITDEMIVAAATNGEHLEILRKVGMTSAMMIPLVARDRVLGVISFVSSERGRRFADEDLQLAERLAHRAALAVDNAVLYRAAQQEIEVRARAEEALRASELRYRTLTNAVSQLIWMNDAQGHTVYCNEQWEQYLGVQIVHANTEFLFEFVHPDDLLQIRTNRAEALEKGTEYEARFRLKRYDGIWRWHIARVVPMIGGSGEVVSWIGAGTDIHEMQTLMEQLTIEQMEVEELNEQLRRAMTETHHRVKNNLQIMAAMVDMQVMDAETAVPVGELRRLNRHIKTLAVIHDLLTMKAREDGRADDLSARAILEQLLPMLQQTAGAKEIGFTAEDAPLSSRQGTSLALVTNELISNALKHGNNRVEVSLTVQNGMATLEVLDDGPGFLLDFDPTCSANTGLELVENLSRWDLDGSAIYTNGPDGGACVKVEFPVRQI